MRAVVLIAACLVATAAAAGQKPAKITITPASPEGAIVMLVPILDAQYAIGIAPYDPATQAIGPSKAGGRYDIETPARRGAAAPGAQAVYFAMVSVEPGTYVVRDVSQQERWSTCYGGETVSFGVAAGQVVYLGVIDAGRSIAQLQAVVRSKPGDERLIGYERRTYFEGFDPPRFQGSADAAQLAAAAAWLKTQSPRTSVVPVSATLGRARFATGTDLLGVEKSCFGWNKSKPRLAN